MFREDCDSLIKMALLMGVILVLLFSTFALCTSCTVSFQNISTNGRASDIVDENQDASPNISPDITIPFTPL